MKRFIFILLLCFSVNLANASNVVFFELSVNNLATAKRFYESLFGWKINQVSSDFMDISGAGIKGGIVRDQRPISGRPNSKLFVEVADIQQSVSRALRLGAELYVPVTEVSPGTFIAEIKDLDENIIGLMYEKKKK